MKTPVLLEHMQRCPLIHVIVVTLVVQLVKEIRIIVHHVKEFCIIFPMFAMLLARQDTINPQMTVSPVMINVQSAIVLVLTVVPAQQPEHINHFLMGAHVLMRTHVLREHMPKPQLIHAIVVIPVVQLALWIKITVLLAMVCYIISPIYVILLVQLVIISRQMIV